MNEPRNIGRREYLVRWTGYHFLVLSLPGLFQCHGLPLHRPWVRDRSFFWAYTRSVVAGDPGPATRQDILPRQDNSSKEERSGSYRAMTEVPLSNPRVIMYGTRTKKEVQ